MTNTDSVILQLRSNSGRLPRRTTALRVYNSAFCWFDLVLPADTDCTGLDWISTIPGLIPGDKLRVIRGQGEDVTIEEVEVLPQIRAVPSGPVRKVQRPAAAEILAAEEDHEADEEEEDLDDDDEEDSDTVGWADV